MLSPSVVALCLAVCPTPAPGTGDGPPAAAPRVAFVEAHAGPARFVAASGALTAFFAAHTIALSLDAGMGRGADLLLRFAGARDDVVLRAEGEPLPTRLRRYRAGGETRSRGYASIVYDGLLPGVDLRALERDGRLAYDLLLAPGSDPAGLVVHVQGARGLSLESERRLVVATDVGPLVQELPAAWQVTPDGTRVPVAARFRVLDDARFGFVVEDRDPALPLVIDPGLSYGTYLGGMFPDRALDVAIAPDGDVVMVGETFSPDFPATPGAWEGDRSGDTDAFVAKIDVATGTLEFATYLGGVDTDLFEPEAATGVVVAPDGTITVCGKTHSLDFPTTTGAYAESSVDGRDAFAARLDAQGQLIWSTYLGGAGVDRGDALALDSVGRVLVAGTTFSTGFPVTPGAFDQSFSSIFFTSDAFVARLSADGSQLDWATFLGGSLREEVGDLIVDGDVPIVVGFTGSVDFPATAGAFDESFNGGGGSDSDVFLGRLSADGSTLVWATYFGGAEIVEGRSVARAGDGDLVVGGVTHGDDLPTSAGVLRPSFGGGLTDGFVFRISGDGTTLRWATYVGGSGDDEITALALTNAGAPTVAGATSSIDIGTAPAGEPFLGNAARGGLSSGQLQGGGMQPGGLPGAPSPGLAERTFDGSLSGARDAYVARLASDGSRLIYGTYLGGSDVDAALGLALDEYGAALVVGETRSIDLPVTALAVDDVANGSTDAFLARLDVPPFVSGGASIVGHDGRTPRLLGHGSLEPGSTWRLELDRARAHAPAVLVVGLGTGSIPFHGGQLVAWPIATVLSGSTDRNGRVLWAAGRWQGFAGDSLVLQSWVLDPDAPAGASASNGLRLLPR